MRGIVGPTAGRRAVDALLEASVVGSWTLLGYEARRRLWSWPDPEARLDGRLVVVIGGTRGIGRAAALACARRGAEVGVVGRRAGPAGEAAAGIREAAGSSSVWSEAADMGEPEQVDRLAERVRQRAGQTLHGLVHAAGMLNREWSCTSSGTETTVAVHVVGPHLLTLRLRPLLERAGHGVVVWMSSGGMYQQRLDVDVLELSPAHYRGALAYARAKRAQVALAGQWDDRLDGGARSFAMHPGWVDTEALREGLPRFSAVFGPVLRTPDQGADTAVWLVAGSAGPGSPSAFWLDRLPRSSHRWPGTLEAPGEADRLWAWCGVRAGLDLWGAWR